MARCWLPPGTGSGSRQDIGFPCRSDGSGHLRGRGLRAWVELVQRARCFRVTGPARHLASSRHRRRSTAGSRNSDENLFLVASSHKNRSLRGSRYGSKNGTCPYHCPHVCTVFPAVLMILDFGHGQSFGAVLGAAAISDPPADRPHRRPDWHPSHIWHGPRAGRKPPASHPPAHRDRPEAYGCLAPSPA